MERSHMSRRWSLEELHALLPAMAGADAVDALRVDEELRGAYLEQARAELQGASTISFLNMPQEVRRYIMFLKEASLMEGGDPGEAFLVGFDMGMVLATLYKRLGREWPFK